MFSLFLGTHEKIGNTEAAKVTLLRSLNLNTHVHTHVCKKGIPKTTNDQNPFTGSYLQTALIA